LFASSCSRWSVRVSRGLHLAGYPFEEKSCVRICAGWGATLPYRPITIRSGDTDGSDDGSWFRLGRPLTSRKILDVISGSVLAARAILFVSIYVIAIVDTVIAVSNCVDSSRKDRRFDGRGVISHDGRCALSLFLLEIAAPRGQRTFLAPSRCPIPGIFRFWLSPMWFVVDNP